MHHFAAVPRALCSLKGSVSLMQKGRLFWTRVFRLHASSFSLRHDYPAGTLHAECHVPQTNAPAIPQRSMLAAPFSEANQDESMDTPASACGMWAHLILPIGRALYLTSLDQANF